jgi:hypothetical protein
MKTRIPHLVALVMAIASFSHASAPAQSATLIFDFQFDVPVFEKPELAPLNDLFVASGIDRVLGRLSYDSREAAFTVTSNFAFSSNIDALFDTPPDELVFITSSGNLNQIRSWDVGIGGVRYLLELTGLDPDEPRPNQWFGGRISETPPDPPNVFELVEAGGGLTPIPLPAAMPLLLGGLGALVALGLRDRRRRLSAPGTPPARS